MDFHETGFKWNELGKLAETFYSQYSGWEYSDLLSELCTITDKLLLLVESLTNEELYGKNWYKSYTLGRMIQFNTSSPMKNMRTKVRRFKKVYAIQ